MDYPFSDKRQYFTAPQEVHIYEFISVMPQCKTVYINQDGEERHVLQVRLPKGCRTDLTCEAELDEHGVTYYHTPLASLDGVVASIYYRNIETDDRATVDSVKWLKWLGQSHTTRDGSAHKKDAIDGMVDNMRREIKSGGKKMVSQEEFDAQIGGDKPKWTKPIGSKSKKKSS